MKLTGGARSVLLVCAITLLGLAPHGGAAQKSKANSESATKTEGGWQTWKSETTKKVYRVKIEQDRFVAEWVNIPPEARKQGAYIRSECRRAGTKWIGTTRAFLPCALPKGANEKAATRTCQLTFRFEVDTIAADRITGAGDTLKGFDCAKCQVLQTGWANFVWVPERKVK